MRTSEVDVHVEGNEFWQATERAVVIWYSVFADSPQSGHHSEIAEFGRLTPERTIRSLIERTPFAPVSEWRIFARRRGDTPSNDGSGCFRSMSER